ncbi:MAG: hypothetical protein PHU23_00055 [Dehalococcoidales bacterium]|nr:hypothetical protein [Dehalococcoidales bacterium]
MVYRKPITSGRGGNHHPLRVIDFIIEYLRNHTEASITEMHRAYKARMEEQRIKAGRKEPYRLATWKSFSDKVWLLSSQGQIEVSENVEESPEPQFSARDEVPTRKLFRLAR